jgi:hypothetical protein
MIEIPPESINPEGIDHFFRTGANFISRDYGLVKG